MTDRTEQLIRDAFADQAARAADSRDVLAALRGGPRRRFGNVLAAAAVIAVVAVVAAVVVPGVLHRAAPPAADRTAPPVVATDVLVVGVDARGNTDAIVLARTGADGSVSLASIPRDTWDGRSKLNRIVVTAGMPAMVDAVADLTGVRAEHHVIVDMSALGALADAVGGVPVCLRAASADAFSGADFPAGAHLLRGAGALAFVRQRHGLPNGDLDRVARQQAFLRGLATRLPDADLPDLLRAVRGRVETDADLDVLGFAQTLARATSLHVGTIPVADVDVETPQGRALAVDPAAVREFVTGLRGTPPSDGVPCVN